MAEYINREVAIEKTEAFCDVFVTKWTDEKVLAWIRNLPAADVVEVVHGRWAKDGDWLICLNCESEINVKNSLGVENRTNYCPNCGAKMDGESEEERYGKTVRVIEVKASENESKT